MKETNLGERVISKGKLLDKHKANKKRAVASLGVWIRNIQTNV